MTWPIWFYLAAYTLLGLWISIKILILQKKFELPHDQTNKMTSTHWIQISLFLRADSEDSGQTGLDAEADQSLLGAQVILSWGSSIFKFYEMLFVRV